MTTHSDWFTKEQAARLIRCSMETIERLAEAGKLEQRMRPQPGGPRPVYNPEDVEREAAERAAAAENGKHYVMPPDIEANGASESDPSLLAVLAKASGGDLDTFAEMLAAAFARALSAPKPSEHIFTPDRKSVV